MCAPMAVMIATTVLSTAMSAYSSIQQGKANEAAYEYQSKVADDNAKLAETYAQGAIATGQAEEQAQRRKTAALMGQQRATTGASGVLVDSGSSLDVTADTAMLGELDAQTVKNNAEWNAYKYRTQGLSYQNSSEMYQSSAANASNAGTMGAATSLLSGAASVSNTWLKYGGDTASKDFKTAWSGENLTGTWGH
jgi:hypothetical protein